MLVPLSQDLKNIEKQNIFISDSKLFKTSQTSCGKEGCGFDVEALEDGQGYIYVGVDINDKKSKEIVLK